MQISYGPPGARGVTQLMAVGADDDPAEASAIKRVAIGSAIAIGAGLVMGNKTARNVGIGALLAALVIDRMRKQPRVVEVTAPVSAPAPSAGWF